MIKHISNDVLTENEATSVDLFLLSGKLLASAPTTEEKKEDEGRTTVTTASDKHSGDVTIMDDDVMIIDEVDVSKTSKKRGRENEIIENVEDKSAKKAKEST